MSEYQQKLLAALFCILMGTLIVLAALGLGPMSNSDIHAPRWIIGIAGLVFLCGGVLLIVPAYTIAKLAAGVTVTGITTIFGWIALFGEDQYFSGGLSLFSRKTDILIARILFGSIALMGIMISVHALRTVIRSKKGKDVTF